MIPLHYKLIGCAGLSLGVFASGYLYGAHTANDQNAAKTAQERLNWGQAIQKAREAVSMASRTNDELKTKLGVQHANAEKALNILLANPGQRVLLPASAGCATGDLQTDSASGVTVQASVAERTPDAHQKAFDDFTRGVEADAAEWSRALNACEVVMEWADSQRN